MITELDEEQMFKLKEAFRCLVSLSEASLVDNHSTCCSYQIEPFNTHWDIKTVEEVRSHVNLYINTWVIPPIAKAFGLSWSGEIDKMLLSWHKSEVRKLELKITEK